MNPPEDLKSAASHASGEYADYRENIDVTQVHAAVEREHREPEAGVVPVPVWLMAVSCLAVFWSGAYLGKFSANFRGDVYNEREGMAAMEPVKKAEGNAPEGGGGDDPKRWAKVYGLTCATCHLATGAGAPPATPPLAKSEFVNGGSKRFLAIVLKGVTGPIDVAGGHYNSPLMVGWEANSAVKDAKKFAGLLSYVRSTWGNTGSPITPEQIEAAKKEFENQKGQWKPEQILAIPADAEIPGGAGDATSAPAKAP